MADPTGSTVPDERHEADGNGSNAPVEAPAGGHAAASGGGGEVQQVHVPGTVATDASVGTPADEPGPEAPTSGAASPTTAPPDTDGAEATPDPAGPGQGETVGAGEDSDAGVGGGGTGEGKAGDERDDVDDGSAKKGSLLTRQVQIDARTILIIAAILAVGVGAYVLGQKQARDASPTASNTAAPPTTGFTPPKDFAPFDDKETGIKLAVPKDWVVYSTKDLDRSYRLLVGVPNAKDNLRVRMNAYSTPVTRENIGDQQAVVDSIFAQEKIQILARETPIVNEMPALYYVYKFTDSSGEPGYHAHFFVFQGRKMVSLVFEAVPEARFAVLAPVFDQIANSLQVAPGDPPAFLQEATGSGATIPPGSGPGATASSAPPSSTP